MRKTTLSGLLIIPLLMHATLWAQSNRATITGTVTDSSGALVAGAEVTATNLGTGAPTQTFSNQDGIYVVPNLPPAQYSVEFKKDGFETLRRPTVTLESTQVARIDAALKVGAISQSMTVTAEQHWRSQLRSDSRSKRQSAERTICHPFRVLRNVFTILPGATHRNPGCPPSVTRAKMKRMLRTRAAQ